MLFNNKYKRIIAGVIKYYDGKITSVNYSCKDVNSAIEFAERSKVHYPQEVIEKLRMVKAMLNCP